MPDPFHIRSVSVGDLAAILGIERASFGKDAYDRNLFAKYLAAPGVLFLAAELGSRLCAYSLALSSGERAEVVSIAVAPRCRGKGMARALLANTLRRLKRRGVTRVSLTVKIGNHAARTLYEKLGFVKTRTVRGYYEDGADGVRMSRRVLTG